MLGLLLCAFLIASVRIADAVDIPNSDFFTFWLAGRLTSSGQDSYSSADWVQAHAEYGATWIPNETFVYPLPLAYVFVPIAALPLFNAYRLWVFLSMTMVLASIVLVTRPGKDLPWNLVAPLMAGVYLLRPTIVTFRNGQLGALLLLILAGSLVLWTRGRWLTGGVVLAMLWLKPNIALPLLPVAAAWAGLTRKPRVISGIAVGTGALALAGWAAQPTWIGDYLTIGAQKLAAAVGFAPSLWGLVGLTCRGDSNCLLRLGLISAATLLFGFSVIVLKLRDKFRPDIFLACAVSLSLFVTPYIWAYDQILLTLPLAVVVGELNRLRWPYLIGGLLPILFALGSLSLIAIAFGVGSDAWSGVLSLATLGSSIWIALPKARPAHAG